MTKYLPQTFENKWIDQWEKEKTYETKEPSKNKPKKYVLDMFPYPSGDGLHVGHPRGYTATDIVARFYRMQGQTVLHPMGWDAFGLPAENAAIKAKKNPQDIVPKNIANFKRQMRMLGFSYDWSREFSTTDPNYYRWTQWLFIQFYKMGLLYKKNTLVYYCSFCKTGLAEEEVLPNGTHERCGTPITRKELPQWLFRIRTYADRLLEDLDGLDWPDGILEMQRNWIGKKEGTNISYKVEGTKETITCFTTRPDTNFGATFIVLAPEHPFVASLLNSKFSTSLKLRGTSEMRNSKLNEVKKYVEKALSKTDLERISEGRKKTGVFTGFYAKNPLNNKLLPIWISDFVLMDFGTGAVVGVPGHDLRDFEFASQFKIPIVRVITADKEKGLITKKEQVFEGEGIAINSDFLDGLKSKEAIKKVVDYLVKKGWGEKTVSYHLRDWIFSRQRYWGEPIPMVYCANCASDGTSWWSTTEGQKFLKNYQKISKVDLDLKKNMVGWFPLTDGKLPLKLPELKSYEPTGSIESPLAKVKEWVNTTCPNCGGEARRETDTMPNWAGSCWYFLKFCDPDNSKEAWSQSLIKKWMPVDWYVGGAEHAVLHLLYSRFWIKALYDLKLVFFKEPFLKLRNLGLILAEDGRKMSKSYDNVINPDDVIAEFGADTLRMHEMFLAPFNQEIAWSTAALQGPYRFLQRVWQIYHNPGKITKRDNDQDSKLVLELQRLINKISSDITNVKFNTAVAAMMEFLNLWEKSDNLSEKDAEKFLKVLAPFAPFVTEEIWRGILKHKDSIHLATWPQIEEVAESSEVKIPVQVNGTLRAVVVDKINVSENTIVDKIKSKPEIKKYLEGKKYKVIYKPGKILNFVTQ